MLAPSFSQALESIRLAVPQGMPPILSWLGTYLIHSTLLGGAALWVCRHRRSPSRRRSWQLAAILLPPITASLVSLVGLTTPLFEPGRLGPSGLGSSPASISSGHTLGIVSVASHGASYWAGCSIALLAAVIAFRRLWLTVGSARRFRQALADRRQVGDSAVRDLVQRLARAAGLKHPVRVSHAEVVLAPTVLGRREIFVPSRLLTELKSDELCAVLAHELAHIRQRDWLWFPLLAGVEAVLGVQPLNRRLARWFRNDAELAADDQAVILTREPESLARALLRVAETAATHRAEMLAPTTSAHGTNLVQRVGRLLATRPRKRAARRGGAWPVLASLPLLWLGVAAGRERGGPLATPTQANFANRSVAASNPSRESIELAERRHALDVELQTRLWEWGLAEDEPSVQQLRREIERMDELADHMVTH